VVRSDRNVNVTALDHCGTRVALRAIEAGLKGDAEALWVAKLLLTADVGSSRVLTPPCPTTRH